MMPSSRRAFLRTAGMAGAALALGPRLGRAEAAAQTRRPPNVVIIFMDDMGFADPGGYGGGPGLTPNIDGLARDEAPRKSAAGCHAVARRKSLERSNPGEGVEQGLGCGLEHSVRRAGGTDQMLEGPRVVAEHVAFADAESPVLPDYDAAGLQQLGRSGNRLLAR